MSISRLALPDIPVIVALIGISLEFCVSANLLAVVGIPYNEEGGTLALKFHPGTVALMIAVILAMAQRGFVQLIFADTPARSFLGCILACLVYAAATTGTGNLIVLLDTFVPVGLVALVLGNATTREVCLLRRVIQAAMLVNALLALAEAATGQNIIPLKVDGVSLEQIGAEFRPTALFDHPLTGAIMAMLGLAVAPLQGRWKNPYKLVMWAALIAFGGRTALAITLAGTGFLAIRLIVLRVLSREAHAGAALLSIGAVMALCLLIGCGLLAAGFGSRLVAHFYWDSSAQVRLAQFDVLGRLDAWQIWFGTRREDLIVLLTSLWLRDGVEVIENFWLLMFINLGVLGFPLFVMAMASLSIGFWRRCDLYGRVLLVSVLMVASTSNSLGRKSSVLVCLVATLLAGLPQTASREARQMNLACA